MGLTRAGVGLGLATDIGGGSNFSMLRTMAAAYEVAQLRGQVFDFLDRVRCDKNAWNRRANRRVGV